MRLPPVLDFLKMLPQSPENFFPLRVAQILPKFIECEMDNVVVMDLLGSHVGAEFKPNAVEEINLLGRKVGSMGPQIKDMLLASREENFEGQLGLGIR
jgi:hypothetical protein